jgi:undecaprenyl-diphosphatase
MSDSINHSVARGDSVPTTPRGEAWIICSVLLVALALLGVARLGYEINEDGTFPFDKWLLLSLRNTSDLAVPIGPRWLQAAFIDLTALGGTTVLTLVSILAVGYFATVRKYRTALFVAAATSGGAILSSLLKMGFARPRPNLVVHLVDVSSASFPSGHAMNSAITYLTLGAVLARAEPSHRKTVYILSVSITLTLLIGISRVYLGVHWPTDVIAGWAVGASWALLCWVIALKLQERRGIEPAPPPLCGMP